MAVRAADRVTLAVLPTPSYVRTYYLKQTSTLAAPAKPTTNPPPSPWSTIEPNYTEGSTDTLYTVMLTGWGDSTFEYGPVQKDSAFEAAKQAWNKANTASLAGAAIPRIIHALTAPTTSNQAPQNSEWMQHETAPSGQPALSGAVIKQWTQVAASDTGSTWVPSQVKSDVIANLDVGKLTVGSGTFSQAVIDEAWLKIVRSRLITTDMLLVGSGANILPDPQFSDTSTQGWGLSTGITVEATGGKTGGPRLAIAGAAAQRGSYYAVGATGRRPTVVPGGKYRIETWVMATVDIPINGVGLYVRVANSGQSATVFTTPSVIQNAAVIPANTWAKVGGIFTVPDGYTQIAPGLFKQASVTTGTVYFSDPAAVSATDASLVVDGAIDGLTITGALFRTAASGPRWELGRGSTQNTLLGYSSRANETSPSTISVSDTTGTLELAAPATTTHPSPATLALADRHIQSYVYGNVQGEVGSTYLGSTSANLSVDSEGGAKRSNLDIGARDEWAVSQGGYRSYIGFARNSNDVNLPAVMPRIHGWGGVHIKSFDTHPIWLEGNVEVHGRFRQANLPESITVWGDTSNNIAATTWTNLPGTNVTEILTVPYPCWVEVTFGAALVLDPGDDVRVGVLLTLDTTQNPDQPSWGAVLWGSNSVSNGGRIIDSGTSSKIVKINAGSTRFTMRAYKASGSPDVNYPIMTLTPLRWAW